MGLQKQNWPWCDTYSICMVDYMVFYKSKVLTMPTTRMCWSRRCWGWRKGRRGPLCYSATGVLPCSAAWTVVQAWSLCKVSSVCLRGRCGGHCGGHQCLVVVMVIEESKSTVIGCHRTFMCNFKYCIVYICK